MGASALWMFSSNLRTNPLRGSTSQSFFRFRPSLTSFFCPGRPFLTTYELVSHLIAFTFPTTSTVYTSFKMVSKTLLIAAVIAYVEARFGQEQVPIQAISQVQGGAGGAAATIAGAAISDLLGAANACDKVSLSSISIPRTYTDSRPACNRRQDCR
jgi:hypothetical protein